MKRWAKFTPVVMVVVALIATTNVHAFDRMVYSGWMCQLKYSDEITGNFNVSETDISYNRQGIFNRTNARRTVVCPIIRDNLVEHKNLQVTVRVSQPAPGVEPAECSLWSWDSGETFIDSDIGEPDDSGDINLSAKTGSEEGGYFNLFCTLPPSTFLYNYLIREE